MDNNELYHHGILGMKWGVRRYQNKDGTLTDKGKKRYNKEMAEVQREKAKIAKEQTALNNRKKTQTKLDKLNAEKEAVENAKRALKEEKRNLKKGISGKTDEYVNETDAERKARILKSTDAKEIYDNKDLLSYNELTERVNRIDLEGRLRSKIVTEQKKTGMDYMNDKLKSGADTIDNATNYFKKVDNAYSTVANSAIGKTLAKKLGLEPPKKEFNLTELWKKRNSLSNEEIQQISKRVTNESIIKKAVDARKEESIKEQRLKDAQKQVDAYNKRWQNEGSGIYSRKGKDLSDARDNIEPEIERVVGEIVDDTPISRTPTVYLISGRSYVSALLEDKSSR